MKLNEINKVIKKVSEELTNINKKYNTNINIFFEDNGSFNHVLFINNDDINNYVYFDLYYKAAFMVDLYEYNNIDENDLIEQIKLNDENLTNEQINAYFNNRYKPQNYTFTIEIMKDDEINTPYIPDCSIDLCYQSIMEEIENFINDEVMK
ncbi:hypothetical protein BUZ51_01975 [Staphylococcus hominis]|uniref:DUF600 family protein n=1 Tax=Staphylococcus hominis TaxID=1290 RepID=A0A974L0U8_STAHO|nr:hypothetical protein [Staphylococcus hominis]PTK31859.1 hypothetical protein BUZ51_01975 [Staphylococcus hominis]